MEIGEMGFIAVCGISIIGSFFHASRISQFLGWSMGLIWFLMFLHVSSLTRG
jgi:hypothetical protein